MTPARAALLDALTCERFGKTVPEWRGEHLAVDDERETERWMRELTDEECAHWQAVFRAGVSSWPARNGNTEYHRRLRSTRAQLRLVREARGAA